MHKDPIRWLLRGEKSLETGLLKLTLAMFLFTILVAGYRSGNLSRLGHRIADDILSANSNTATAASPPPISKVVVVDIAGDCKVLEAYWVHD